jgi:hypothetical protein
MSLKKLYLPRLEPIVVNGTEESPPVIPPRGTIFQGAYPNTAFKLDRIHVLGKHVRATHLIVPDEKAEEGFFRSHDMKNVCSHTVDTESGKVGKFNFNPQLVFDPGNRPFVKLQNDSDEPQRFSAALVGSRIVEAEHEKEWAPRDYVCSLWDLNPVELHTPKRYALKPASVVRRERAEHYAKMEKAKAENKSIQMYHDDTSFRVQSPVRCAPMRIFAKSNSKMDVYVNAIQSGNVNHEIGISHPIDMLHGGLDLRMGIIDTCNSIVVELGNASDEERWVEIWVEVDTNVPPPSPIHPRIPDIGGGPHLGR